MLPELMLSPVRRWRRQALAGLCLLLAGLALAASARWLLPRPLPAGAAMRAYPGLVRFHVLAAGNGAAAQQQKQAVRDALLPLLQEAAADAASAAEVLARLQSRQDRLLAAARSALARGGPAPPVRIEVGHLSLDGRRVGALRLPAGEYPALRVVLGSGAGRNWWCILFPNVCFDGWIQAVDADPALLSAAEAALSRAIDDGAVVVVDERDLAELPAQPRLAILRWLDSLAGGR